MPTYQNNTEADLNLLGPSKESISVAAGQSVAVQFYTADTRFTKTSDEPYSNNLKNRHEIALTAEYQDIVIDLSTDYLMVIKISDKVTVFQQNESNTPPRLKDHTDEHLVLPIKAKGRFEKLRVSGIGTCEIIECVYEDFTR